MPAPLSIIIPTRDAADTIGPCLAALSEGLTEGLIHELIIVDSSSGDAISDIAEAIGARFLTAPRGRGPQLAAGAKAAKGAWFLFLHADTILPEGWPAVIRTHIRAHPETAGWFGLAFDEQSLPARLTAGWANLRSRLFRLPYGDQALLIARPLYTRIGGYPDLPVMEDVALARALKSRQRALGLAVTTSGEKYRRNGWLRQGTNNLAALIRYLVTGTLPRR
jgi:rSAM/selenodomain-associated transferase 2